MNPHAVNLRRIAMTTTSPDVRQQLTEAADAIDSLESKQKTIDFGVFNTILDRLSAVEAQMKGCASRMDLEMLEMQLHHR